MSIRHFNIAICQENGEIIKNNKYLYNVYDGTMVHFDHSLKEHQKAIVYSPEHLEKLVEKYQGHGQQSDSKKIEVINEDSFSVPTDCVLNFADAKKPGGLYFEGASAQEEALCRQSTLYASLDSKEAEVVYITNRQMKTLDSDYLLVSPCVEVFRDRELNLLARSHTTAVISSAAPNRYGRACHVDMYTLRGYYRKRIRHILCAAVDNGYKSITLGAWGCGAFGNNPKEVASAFYDILINEDFEGYFDKIIFSIPDKQSENYKVFRNVMVSVLSQAC